ncbi:hypothetical protein pb186bvf_008044 [Paramecium bursaria]
MNKSFQATKTKAGIGSFFTQLLVLRFVSKLRQYSNNINIHSVKQEHLSYVNDPTLIKSHYAYYGHGIRKLIKINQQATLPCYFYISKHIQKFIHKQQTLMLLYPQILLFIEVITALITILQLFTITLSITFDFDLPDSIDLLSYLFILFEIFLKYNIGFYERSNIIQKKGNIDFQFLFDLLTLLPQLIYFFAQNTVTNYLRLLFYYRCSNINLVFAKIEYKLSDLKQNFLQLIKLYFTLITAAHIIGCFWYILGTTETENWILAYFTDVELDKMTLYITSLYWSITTMLTVGYGDVLPVNQNEKIYAILTMLIGCCLFGYVMNSIGVIFDRINNNEKQLRLEMQRLNNFLDSKNIDEKLKSKFRKYLEHTHLKQQSHKLMGKRNIQNISAELMLEFNHQIITKLSHKNFLLGKFEYPVILQLSKVLQEQNFLPDELVYEKSSTSFHLYMILQGQVIEQFQRQSNQIVEHYKSNQCFGEVDFISGQRIQCGFISETFTNTFTLERETLYQIVRDTNYFDFEKLCYITDLVLFSKDLRGFERVCPVCYKKDHYLYTCLQIHYYPNINRIIFQNLKQERKQQPRRFSKSKGTLKNLNVICAEQYVFWEDNRSMLQYDEMSERSDEDEKLNISEEFNTIDDDNNKDESKDDDTSQLSTDKLQIQRRQLNKRTILDRVDYKEKVQQNINAEILNHYRQQRQNRSNTKYINGTQTNIQHKESFFGIKDFDKVAQFRSYFPNHNIDNIIKRLY